MVDSTKSEMSLAHQDEGDVVAREREFHNLRFAEEVDPRAHLDKWYGAIRRGAQAQNDRILELANGSTVLEYGCADGALSLAELKVPARALRFEGIDISDVAVAKASSKAKLLGFGNAYFQAMNAERMEYPDNTFDVVFGRGIVHHLDLRACFSEVKRVLKPNGRAVFFEPLGHNPLLNWYRRRTPDMRTADEHPLLMADIALARTYYSDVTVRYYGMLTLLGVALQKSDAGILRSAAELGDRFLLSIPGVRSIAWYALLEFRK